MAILGILFSLLTPGLSAARDKAKQAGCVNNLRQIHLAATMYANENDGWLPHSGNAQAAHTPSNHTWKGLIAPHLNLHSTAASTLERGVFHCPSQKNTSCGYSSFGNDGFYGGYGWNLRLGWRDIVSGGYPPWVNLAEISDSAGTIMAGDTNDAWIGAGAGGADSYAVFYIYQAGDISLKATRHTNGGNYLWADGHVSCHSAAEAMEKSGLWFPVK